MIAKPSELANQQVRKICLTCTSLDSDGNPILIQSELGKLVRNSAKAQNIQNRNQQQLAAATRNLYNRQQPMQFDQSQAQFRRNYGNSDQLNGYNPVMGASNGRGQSSNSDADDDEGSSFGPGFGSNFDSKDDDGEGSSANNDGQPMNLNQAASGYPNQGDYNNDNGATYSFGGSGFGAPMDGAEFGPSDGFGGEGRRSKSGSSPMGARNYGSADDDGGALQFGPNSAINSGGDGDDEGRSGYAPEGNDNENDDE